MATEKDNHCSVPYRLPELEHPKPNETPIEKNHRHFRNYSMIEDTSDRMHLALAYGEEHPEESAEDIRRAVLEGKIFQSDRLELRDKGQRIRIDGQWYELRFRETRLLESLLDIPAAWIQGYNLLSRGRPDKILNAMPPEVSAIIETSRDGYRIKPEYFSK